MFKYFLADMPNSHVLIHFTQLRDMTYSNEFLIHDILKECTVLYPDTTLRNFLESEHINQQGWDRTLEIDWGTDIQYPRKYQ